MCINKLGNVTDTMHSSLLTLQISINIATPFNFARVRGGGGMGMPATKRCASCEAVAS